MNHHPLCSWANPIWFPWHYIRPAVIRFGMHQAIKSKNVSMIHIVNFIWISRKLEKKTTYILKKEIKIVILTLIIFTKGWGTLSESSMSGNHCIKISRSSPYPVTTSLFVLFCKYNGYLKGLMQHFLFLWNLFTISFIFKSSIITSKWVI